MVDNINEWKKNESSLKQTAVTDPLTGVYNRGYGLQALEQAIFDVKNGMPYCAAFIDLDGLKSINDKHGHTNGDYAIRTIADVLVSSVRDNRDTVCRFGGDEFIIVFKNCTESAASKAITRMRSKLYEINRTNGKDFNVDFSHGIVELDALHTNEMRLVIEEMDQMMYKNKAKRKQASLLANGRECAIGDISGAGDLTNIDDMSNIDDISGISDIGHTGDVSNAHDITNINDISNISDNAK
jgi:diguanylate cyclase (GGDEF)-like protein